VVSEAWKFSAKPAGSAAHRLAATVATVATTWRRKLPASLRPNPLAFLVFHIASLSLLEDFSYSARAIVNLSIGAEQFSARRK